MTTYFMRFHAWNLWGISIGTKQWRRDPLNVPFRHIFQDQILCSQNLREGNRRAKRGDSPSYPGIYEEKLR